MITHLIRCSLMVLAFSCSDAPPTTETVAPAPAVFPGAEWTYATPAARGVDSTKLSAALDFLASHSKGDGLTETMVIRDGYVIWAGDSIERVHDIWSCTKSFTSTAVGLMVEEGLLSLDQPVAEHETRLREAYPEATYRHFLTMTSGYDARGATRWDSDVSEDWSETPYEPTTPLFAPGTAYTYWDEAMIMLGRALTTVVDTSLNDYLDQRVFSKIGIPKRAWWGEEEVEGVPINFGGTGLKMSASEQARFGLLMLNDGYWDGQRILPEGWVAAATVNQVPKELALGDTDRKATDGRGVYGYNWWIINAGTDAPVAAAFTSGLNHNVCLVIPAWDMVIVRQGTDGNPEYGKHRLYSELLGLLADGVS